MSTAAAVPKPSFFGGLDDIQPSPRRDPTHAAGAVVEAQPTIGRKPASKDLAARPREVSSGEGREAPWAREPDLRAVDRAGERLGFASREAVIRRRKRQPIEEPVDQINLRAAIADINRFVAWCEARRYSYREGFAELVKLIDAD